MRFLAVDDEQLALESLLDVIEQVEPGAERRGFRNPADALNACASWTPDVVLLDVDMRELNGLELARALQLLSPQINIIFATGYDSFTKEALELHASGYLLKPITAEKLRGELEYLRFPPIEREKAQSERVSSNRIRVRTFGCFEAFYQNKPLHFQYRKTKELLAYLIDRKGSLCGNYEIISVLWEDCDASHKMSYLQRLRGDLSNVLRKCGAEDVLVRKRGEIGVCPEKLDCDYYSWLNGKPLTDIPGGGRYCGEYMAQYSWAEYTNAWLYEKQLEFTDPILT